MELHAGLRGDAGGLSLASGGTGAGLGRWALVRYVLWMASALTRLPGHAVYFSNRYLKYWLVYAYALFTACAITGERRRKYAVAAALAAVTLPLTVGLNVRPAATER